MHSLKLVALHRAGKGDLQRGFVIWVVVVVVVVVVVEEEEEEAFALQLGVL